MNIVPEFDKPGCISNVEIEQVQQEEKEYVLLGSFLRTPGLRLFYYNPTNREIKEATIKYSDTIHIYKMPDNKFITIDWEAQKTTIDSKCIYFECLNMQNAERRVMRYQMGLIKELFNLRKPDPEGIKLY